MAATPPPLTLNTPAAHSSWLLARGGLIARSATC
jgi:hypothetical protein